METATTVDAHELARFSALAAEWWDPKGKFAVLHRFNPVRIGYIRDAAARHWNRDVRAGHPLDGLRILDVGCGGGLLSEPLARLGAQVIGIDPSERNVKTAAAHAEATGTAVDYRAVTAEELAAAGEHFDIVLAMEVIEHVADVDLFIEACASMVRPGGLMIAATINRTPKAFLLAIVGAEYLLGWLPRGTHAYDKLVKPGELDRAMRRVGLEPEETVGVVFNPLTRGWRQSSDTDVNYMMRAVKRD